MQFVSDRMAELSGFPAADFIGSRVRSYSSIIHPEDRAAVQEAVAEATHDGKPFELSYRIHAADGAVRHVLERGRLVVTGADRYLDGLILDVTPQHEAEQLLRQSLARQATMEERGRIARDLHDSVSQSLFSISLHARAAQLAAERAGTSDGPILHSIGELLSLANGALAEMRALIFELRPGALAEEGLAAAVRKHAAALASREDIEVTVSAPERVPLDPKVEEALYRVVQEALNNAIKHARPQRLSVTMAERGQWLLVEICDDGIGFDPTADHPGHIGLRTMRERASALGGTLHVRSNAGKGTTVTAAGPMIPA